MRQRQRQQRRTGQGRHHMQRRDRPGVPRQRRARRCHRGLGLADMHDAFGEDEMRAERIGGPEQHRVPMRGFPRHQRLGMRRRDRTADRSRDISRYRRRPHRPDRPPPRPTLLANRVSGMVRGSIISPCAFHSAAMPSAISARRRHQRPAGRRAHRLAVERDPKAAIRLGDAGLRIKALALRPARGAPDRLLRIERGFARPLRRIIHACGFCRS